VLLAGSPRKGKERSSSVKTRLFLSLHERFYDAPRGWTNVVVVAVPDLCPQLGNSFSFWFKVQPKRRKKNNNFFVFFVFFFFF
jgi:hypothetical protein